MFPFSRERRKILQLQRELAVYRLVFGQPRQEDLLALLAEGREEAPELLEEMRICLEPPGAAEVVP